MKKQILLPVLTAAVLLCLTGAIKHINEPVLHLGLNAEITKIDTSKQILYVSGTDASSRKLFDDHRAIDCSKAIETDSLLYVNYDSEHDVITIDFEDFIVGDRIILGIWDSELHKEQPDALVAEQIQLGTQRLH